MRASARRPLGGAPFLDSGPRPTLSLRLPLFLLLLLALPGAVWAQESPRVDQEPADRAGWLSVGLGGGSEGMAVGASLTARSGRHAGSLRGVFMGPVTIFEEREGKDVSDVSLLYVRGVAGQRSWRSLGLGLGMVWGTEYRPLEDWTDGGERDRKIGPTVGLAVEGQLNWQPTQVIGLGLLAFGNVNSDSPAAGLLVTVQGGSLR